MVNLQSLFQDFSPSKLVVYSSLLAFTILLALRGDGTITWSYWAVFTPLWLWKALALSGSFTGSYVWCTHPLTRMEGDSNTHYKAMLLSVILHLFLILFETFACDKLQTGRHLWVLIFIPLIFVSVLCIGVCIWAVKHDRPFQLELWTAVNVLQWVLIALRLDEYVVWDWEVVFTPMWIVLCVCLVGVLYSIVFAGVLLRTPEVSVQQRRTATRAALAYSCLVIPALVFQVFLCTKLNGSSSMPWVAVCTPLYWTLFMLTCMAFGSKGANIWWFGIRKDFCQWLLGVCPLLQEYGNISYSLHCNSTSTITEEPISKDVLDKSRKTETRVVVSSPVSIDVPD